MLQIVIYIAATLMLACVGADRRIQPDITTTTLLQPTPRPTAIEVPTVEHNVVSLIRQIDFANFSFPELPSKKCSKKVIDLTNGRYDAPEHLKKLPSADCWSVVFTGVDYGDVTGDNEEEAIVKLYAELGGNSSYSDVYIYSLVNKQPTMLWKFMTGDRADGGLKRIYSEAGKLVVELFGIDTNIEHLESSEDVADCCPKHFTKTKYKWDGKRFQQDGKEEVLPIPSG
jgi:hypothetical protein